MSCFNELFALKVSANQVLDLFAETRFRVLAEKALVFCVAGFAHRANRELIASWPDAIPSEWGIDAVATLNFRYCKNGAEAIRCFGDTVLTASDFVCAVETVSWSLGQDQLQSAVIGANWHNEIEELLLK